MDRSREKVLISGGAGFLGSYVVSELLGNYDVFVLERTGCNLARIKNHLERIGLFYSDEAGSGNFIKENQFDYIINCSVLYGPEEKLSTLISNNVVMPLLLIESAGSSIKAFINTDTFFNRPENRHYSYLRNYTLTKKHLEESLKCLPGNLKIINLKLEHIYGPMDNANKFIPSMLRKLHNNITEIALTPGDQLRDFIYVKDAAKAYSVILKNTGKLPGGYNEFSVGTGKSTSIKDLTLTMKSLLKSYTELKFGSIPYRENEIMHSTGNPGPLRKLGWNAEYSLLKGLRETIEFERSGFLKDSST